MNYLLFLHAFIASCNFLTKCMRSIKRKEPLEYWGMIPEPLGCSRAADVMVMVEGAKHGGNKKLCRNSVLPTEEIDLKYTINSSSSSSFTSSSSSSSSFQLPSSNRPTVSLPLSLHIILLLNDDPSPLHLPPHPSSPLLTCCVLPITIIPQTSLFSPSPLSPHPPHLY